MLLRKETYPLAMNAGFNSCQEETQVSALARPIQDKTLLQVADCRRHVRSDSDPTKCHKTNVLATNSSTHAAVTSETPPSTPKKNVNLETEEAFIKLPVLRSKCRSISITVASNHFNGWFRVKNDCSSIY